jgi:hypothetical protein
VKIRESVTTVHQMSMISHKWPNSPDHFDLAEVSPRLRQNTLDMAQIVASAQTQH